MQVRCGSAMRLVASRLVAVRVIRGHLIGPTLGLFRRFGQLGHDIGHGLLGVQLGLDILSDDLGLFRRRVLG